ncbi:hypothetical protein HDU76_012645 [Blyttiomyces sp. JEL0837]|nr:hypothetical protein HDU76_012645 [Blyttiomyces sp. JEL0837]
MTPTPAPKNKKGIFVFNKLPSSIKCGESLRAWIDLKLGASVTADEPVTLDLIGLAKTSWVVTPDSPYALDADRGTGQLRTVTVEEEFMKRQAVLTQPQTFDKGDHSYITTMKIDDLLFPSFSFKNPTNGEEFGIRYVLRAKLVSTKDPIELEKEIKIEAGPLDVSVFDPLNASESSPRGVVFNLRSNRAQWLPNSLATFFLSVKTPPSTEIGAIFFELVQRVVFPGPAGPQQQCFHERIAATYHLPGVRPASTSDFVLKITLPDNLPPAIALNPINVSYEIRAVALYPPPVPGHPATPEFLVPSPILVFPTVQPLTIAPGYDDTDKNAPPNANPAPIVLSLLPVLPNAPAPAPAPASPMPLPMGSPPRQGLPMPPMPGGMMPMPMPMTGTLPPPGSGPMWPTMGHPSQPGFGTMPPPMSQAPFPGQFPTQPGPPSPSMHAQVPHLANPPPSHQYHNGPSVSPHHEGEDMFFARKKMVEEEARREKERHEFIQKEIEERLRREAEENEKRKIEEERMRKQAAELLEKKRIEEELARQQALKRAEEEEAKRKADEIARKLAEEEAKRAAEQERLRKELEEQKAEEDRLRMELAMHKAEQEKERLAAEERERAEQEAIQQKGLMAAKALQQIELEKVALEQQKKLAEAQMELERLRLEQEQASARMRDLKVLEEQRAAAERERIRKQMEIEQENLRLQNELELAKQRAENERLKQELEAMKRRSVAPPTSAPPPAPTAFANVSSTSSPKPTQGAPATPPRQDKARFTNVVEKVMADVPNRPVALPRRDPTVAPTSVSDKTIRAAYVKAIESYRDRLIQYLTTNNRPMHVKERDQARESEMRKVRELLKDNPKAGATLQALETEMKTAEAELSEAFESSASQTLIDRINEAKLHLKQGIEAGVIQNEEEFQWECKSFLDSLRESIDPNLPRRAWDDAQKRFEDDVRAPLLLRLKERRAGKPSLSSGPNSSSMPRVSHPLPPVPAPAPAVYNPYQPAPPPNPPTNYQYQQPQQNYYYPQALQPTPSVTPFGKDPRLCTRTGCGNAKKQNQLFCSSHCERLHVQQMQGRR